jgi:formyl-CoA transferase
VSVVDIATGHNAYVAILEALIARERTGEGADIHISMFDSIADWLTVPLLQFEGGMPPRRLGLAHPSIAPYGVFRTADGRDILVAVQSDREWRVLCGKVLGRPELGADPHFATNVERCRRRAETDAAVAQACAALTGDELLRRLAAAEIAFATMNDMAGLAAHPHLGRIEVETPSGTVAYPAPPNRRCGYGPVPALGEHTGRVRAEFADAPEARRVP